MIKDISYGRIASSQHSARRRRRNEKISVRIAFWLPDWIPYYVQGTFLQYFIGDREHRIYNPLQFAFEIGQLKTYISQWHIQNDEIAPSSFSVIEST